MNLQHLGTRNTVHVDISNACVSLVQYWGPSFELSNPALEGTRKQRKRYNLKTLSKMKVHSTFCLQGPANPCRGLKILTTAARKKTRKSIAGEKYHG